MKIIPHIKKKVKLKCSESITVIKQGDFETY